MSSVRDVPAPVPAATTVTSDRCKWCGGTENLQRCTRCKSVKYCSKEHQIEDWRNGGHKKVCEAIIPSAAKKKKRSKKDKKEEVEDKMQQNTPVDELYMDPIVALPYPTEKEVEDKMQQNAPVDELYMDPIDALPYPTEKSPEEIAKEEMEKLLLENLNANKAAAAVQQSLYNMSTYPVSIPHLDDCEFPLYRDANLRLSLQLGSGYIDKLCSKLVADMAEFGMCVIDNFLGEDFGKEVLSEVHEMYKTDGVFKNGQVVAQTPLMDKIRGDKIAWVNGTEGYCPNIREMIGHVDQLITTINGRLGNYDFRIRTKAMVAIYPGGGSHYVKHVDNPNRDGRCITAIYYLNENWNTKICGGLLRIFPTRNGSNLDNKVANIEPIFDRLFLFWSDRRNPHEVQPAYQTRYAITLWYYDSYERAEARRNYLRGVVSAPQS